MRSAALAFAIAIACLEARAEERAGTFVAEGSASFDTNDIDSARQRATEEAIRRAVFAAVGTLAHESARKANETLIRKRILRASRSYVSTFTVLEEVVMDGLVKVRLEADVKMAFLEKELSALGLTKAGARKETQEGTKILLPAVPRVAVRVVGGESFADVLRETLARELGALGYELAVFEPGGSALYRAREASMGAALLIEIAAEDAGRIRGTTLVGKDVLVKVRLVDSAGALVTELSEDRSAAGANADAAASEAVRAAITGAVAKLSGTLTSQLLGPNPDISVEISGFDKWSQVAEIRRLLGQVPGVTSVLPARFGSQTVSLALSGKASTSLVTRELMGATFTFGVPRVSTNGQRISVSVARETP